MAKSKEKKTPVVPQKRSGKERRETERRTEETTVSDNRRQGQRRKVQRRRQIDPTTCERDYTGEEIEFMGALDDYKRRSGRMFPTCSEILEVLRDLGYERRPGAEDQEAAADQPDAEMMAEVVAP